MEQFINQNILGDCREVMQQLPDNSIDLVMTSPPYAEARKNTYGGIPPDEYIQWFIPIAQEIYRVLKPSGSFILNIGDNTIDGETHLYTFEIPIVLKRRLGFKFIDPLIWHKKTAPPGKFKNRFKDSWEFCYHFSKTLDITWNPQSVARAMREKETNVKISESGSGFSSAASNMKRRIRSNGSGVGTNDERLAALDTALPGNVLWLAGETTNVGHSAAYPSEVPEFFIKAFTNEGDVVLDPFSGSGTTLFVARKLHRNYIGIELLKENIDNADLRLHKELGMFR